MRLFEQALCIITLKLNSVCLSAIILQSSKNVGDTQQTIFLLNYTFCINIYIYTHTYTKCIIFRKQFQYLTVCWHFFTWVTVQQDIHVLATSISRDRLNNRGHLTQTYFLSFCWQNGWSLLSEDAKHIHIEAVHLPQQTCDFWPVHSHRSLSPQGTTETVIVKQNY